LVKSDSQISWLRESAKLNLEALTYIFDLLEEGISEEQIQEAYKKYVLDKGATGIAFDPIIGFGDHTATPHHKVTARKLKKGDAVILDVGLILDGYASDVTRSFFFKIEGDPKFEIIVREAHKKALEMCKPGADFGDIGLSIDNFFREKGVFEYRKHNLGHGVGKEVHEDPRVNSIDRILKEGMVITIEPGLYQTGLIGYRHEDTILITKKGCENFYESWDRTR
jgi:Xaa-Pro aminopeptidase